MSPRPNDLFQFHEPVLVKEVLEHLLPEDRAGLVVDGTVGTGGHAKAILEAREHVTVLGLDRDPAAIEIARARLASFGDRVALEHATYAELAAVLDRRQAPAPIGVLLDIGLSSLQLDDPARGFSFRADDSPLDMRFDPAGSPRSAEDLVNHASERDLANILHEYGDEPRSRAVARAIVAARPLRTVGALRKVVARTALRVRRHDPATRTFQALRIAVNEELAHLERGLAVAIERLARGGRLVVVAFHSGEERCVKAAFRLAAREGRGRILTKKPIRPTEQEVARNPRARPARLRALAIEPKEIETDR